MSDISKRLAGLSPEKRALLMKKLQEKAQKEGKKQTIVKRVNQDEYPMSFAQQRMWFHNQLAPDTSLNNIPAAIRMLGSLNVKALQDSLNEIIHRHEVLRASFVTKDGVPHQVVAPGLKLDLPVIDLQHIAASEREATAKQKAREEALVPFDLSKGPMIRAKLLRLNSEDHIIVLSLHHIISDGWSTGVLVMEVAQLYKSFLNNKPSPLPELPIQYADFAQWQQEYLQGDVLVKLVNYWKNQLADSPPMLELPTDRPRPTAPVFYGAHLRFQLSKKVSDALRSISRQEEATLFMTLLAAFKTLLHRYTGQKDLCVGSPIANRDQAETEALIGFFVNVLAMRTKFNDNPTFRQLLQQVRRVAMDAYAHQALPFERIVEEMNVPRDISYNPLFQVLFDVQNTSSLQLKLPGLILQPIELESGTVKFDLVLSMEDNPANINGVIGYNKVLFEESTIQRMIDHYKKLLESIAVNPDQKISELQILGNAERQKLVVDWNKTEVDYGVAKDKCIHHLFEQQAEQAPDQVAIIFAPQGRGERRDTGFHQEDGGPSVGIRDSESLTYRELNERANQLAHYLRKKGVAADSLVALCPDRSMDMIVGLLGVLKAGGAYVPIDPTYPAERIDFILSDAGITTVLTHQQYISRFNSDSLNIVCLDKDREFIAQENKENLPDVVSNDNLAYMIYTSGSTGTPKGVMVPHKGLVNHALTLANTYELTAEDRILEFISLTFDASAEEIYPTLVGGATLVIVRSPSELTGNDLLDLINNQRISILHLPAAVWHNWQDHLERNKVAIPDHLRILFVGGESPSVEKLNSMRKLAKHDFNFFNVYGPTEATITSCYFEMDNSSKAPFNEDVIPIGKPIRNANIYLLDQHLNPVPIGVPGEMYIAGAGITRGYFNRPDTTAEHFIPDPFSKQAGARLYKTGDLARFLPDGNIVFWGRVDFQVKVRGFRIELGEIESVISHYESVSQVAVLAREDSPGIKRIVAYIVLDENEPASIDELREFIRVRLPEYMMPSAFVLMPEMPLTSHGKIDRRALPAPDSDRPDSGIAFVPPRDRLEQFLAKMWQEILGIEKIGIYDNFFELGGNSILGATFINRLQDQIGEYIYLIAIFDAPTIARMADYLKKEYPTSASKILGIEITTGAAQIERIDPAKVDYLRKIIVSLPPRKVDDGKLEPKNPPAIFLLSAPRSGSTLFRVMMGGNPKIFAPPELQLLNYNTLEDQKAALGSERDEFWLDGSIRAIMELKSCDADEAKRIMADCVNQKLTVKQFFRLMQEWLGDRIFFDKTPNYSLDLNTIKRAEQDFENAMFIHLIRHPYGVIPSFEKARLHVFYPPFFKEDHHFSPRELAELVWVITHQNILEFLGSIPAQRQYRVRYEDLVKHPEPIIEEICQFLNVDFHPAMLEPQKDKKKKMTDAIHPLAKMLGDVRFFEHKGINATRADHWKDKIKEDYLGDITWDLVEYFGYEERPERRSIVGTPKKELMPIEPISRDEELPLSFGQQRLWFLDQMEPDSPFYNMSAAVQLQGELKIDLLEQCLNEIVARHEILRTTFQTEEGKARQVIAAELKLTIPIIDLTASTQSNRLEQAKKIAIEEGRRPFNLSEGPLFRCTLLKLDENDYIMLSSMHHIISDGWSMGILINELATLYRAFLGGNPSPLAALSIQYADYAAWQRKWLESEAVKSQLGYWKNKLAGSPPMLELPTDRPRPAVQTFRGSRQFFQLPVALSNSILALSQRQEVTPYMTMLAAFQTLLHRYSHQDDICVGTPIANRNREEIEPLIGFFVNTLVLRTDFSNNLSFQDLLRQVRKTATEAYANQDIPFEMLVDELQPQRDLSHTPLFQVMFTFQDASTDSFTLPGLTISPIEAESGTAKFDLTMSIGKQGDHLGGLLEFNTDLFNPSTIQRMLKHFHKLLEAVVAEPDQKISQLALLSDPELDSILNQFNDTDREFPHEKCIHHLFEEKVVQSPDSPALIFEDQQLTYNELNQRANQVAHYLQKKGVGPEVVVGICLERSMDMIIAMLGVLKAGGAYLPLDPAYPLERLALILKDSGAPVLITQQSLQPMLTPILPGKDTLVILMDTDWEIISKEVDGNPVNKVTPDNLAYLIYTSGSTGIPKAVMAHHRGLVNHALSTVDVYDLNPADRMLQFLSFSFDASGEEIYPPLISGAGLVIASNPLDLSNDKLFDFCQQHKLTILHFPAVVWHAWQDYLTQNNLAMPGKIKVMAVGGDAPSVERVSALRASAEPHLKFINIYGPTETTIAAALYELEKDSDDTFTYDAIPIGHPIQNAKIYLLDRNLNPVPVGVEGEMYVGGVGVTRGYYQRPDITAANFIPDPFSNELGARLYKTGDLARYLPNGNIVFCGRADFQVKIRGFRIELGEIEATLAQHPDLKEAVVVDRTDDRGTKRLIAYILPKDTVEPNSNKLKSFLTDRLPEYMIPSVFVTLDSIPKTATGKLDRKALPDPELSRPEPGSEFAVPETDREKKLAEIWSQILGIEKISINDNFFELGGDSILTIQVIAKAKQAGLQITPKQLFQYPTIGRLAEIAGTAVTVQAEQGPVTGEVPLTPIQHWFFEQGYLEPNHWNQSILLEISGQMEIAHLKKAIEHLFHHHDALRLRFEQTETGWRQFNNEKEDNLPFSIFDVSNSSPLDQKLEIEKIASKVQDSLNITLGPMVKFAYFHLGDEHSARLLIAIHHLAIDGVSWRVLMEDLHAVYQQLAKDEPVQLPAKTSSYKQWSSKLTEYAQSPGLEQELAYWNGITNKKIEPLPVDYPGGSNIEMDADKVQVTLDEEKTKSLLQEVPPIYGTEINDILLTAVAMTFSRWTGERSIILDLEGHGREDIFEDVDISRTVGWFTSQYPVFLDLGQGHSIGEWIKAVKEQVHQVPERGIGFGLLRYLNRREDLTNKLSYKAEVSFNYLGQFDHKDSDAALFKTAMESKGIERSLKNPRTHLISINGSIIGARLKVVWSYSKKIYNEETINRLAKDFIESLHEVIAHCQSAEAGGYTPSDFKDIELDQSEIDELMEELSEV